MSAADCFVTALKCLLKKKTRNFLTALGIGIGILVIVFINISSSSGLSVIKKETSRMGINCGIISDEHFSDKKISDIQKQLGKDYFISTVFKNKSEIVFADKMTEVFVYGCDEELTDILGYKIISGRNITLKDLINQEKVIIIDSVTADELFDSTDVLGKSVIINGEEKNKYTVVGISDSSVLSGKIEAAVPSCVFVPHTTFADSHAVMPRKLYIETKRTDYNEECINAVLNSVNSSYSFTSDLKLEENGIYKENIEFISDTMRMILMLIALVSVLSGCISMINILFIEIGERKKEIALRKALGETNCGIILQLISENIIIMLIASLSGIICGSFLSGFALTFVNIDLVLDLSFQLFIISCSVIAGIVFGMMPLGKIFKMNPVDIL